MTSQNMYNDFIQEEIKRLKEHFEANVLDGDDVKDCGKTLLSAESVLEYMTAYLPEIHTRLLKRLEGEIEKNKKSTRIVNRPPHDLCVACCETCGNQENCFCEEYNKGMDDALQIIKSHTPLLE